MTKIPKEHAERIITLIRLGSSVKCCWVPLTCSPYVYFLEDNTDTYALSRAFGYDSFHYAPSDRNLRLLSSLRSSNVQPILNVLEKR